MENRKTILIIDDSRLVRQILVRLLQEDYHIVEAVDGSDAIDRLQELAPALSAVLLDIVMPEMDGFQVLAFMRRMNLLKSIPVLIITADEAERYTSLAYELGVSEVIQKPFNPNIVKQRIRNLVDLYAHKNNLEKMVTQQTEAIRSKTRQLMQTNDIMIDALSTIIEYRSLESGQHIRRIRMFTKILLEHVSEKYPQYHLHPAEIKMISSAAVMHDIGKIAIPDSVLLKPGKLTPEEFEIMKTHTVKGHEILDHLRAMDNKQYLDYCRDICLFHHERWDGSGYPKGLKGEAIPLAAQVVSIADAYDALTHTRVYKPAYTHEEATNMILHGECGVFSRQLLRCFTHVLPYFKELSNLYTDSTPL